MRLTQVMEALFENSSKTKQRFELSVVALEPEQPQNFGAIKVTPFPVSHGDSGGPFLAYRVVAEGRVITYSADTEWTEALVPAARDADLFIAEAYYYDRIVKNHLSLTTLEAHVAEIRPKRLVLTHMSERHAGATGYAGLFDGERRHDRGAVDYLLVIARSQRVARMRTRRQAARRSNPCLAAFHDGLLRFDRNDGG